LDERLKPAGKTAFPSRFFSSPFRRLERNGVRAQALEVLINEKLIGADFSPSSLEATFVKSSCAPPEL